MSDQQNQNTTSTDGDPSTYWSTAISEVHPEHVTVRGYDLGELVGMPFSAATFLMIRGRIPTPAETRVVDAVLTGVLDYGLEKPGTVAARYVVSSNPSMVAGLATAALSAGEYSLATEDAAEFIQQTYDAYVAAGEPDIDGFAEQVVSDAGEQKIRIPGFGHPVFRGEDPRAQRLRRIAVDAGLWGPAARLYEAVHGAFIQHPKRAHFPINDIGILAAICVVMGFSPKESTALAVIGTLPGVAAHVSEEVREGKPVRVVERESVTHRMTRRKLVSDLDDAGWTDADRWT